jgi:hypothetical protein
MTTPTARSTSNPEQQSLLRCWRKRSDVKKLQEVDLSWIETRVLSYIENAPAIPSKVDSNDNPPL